MTPRSTTAVERALRRLEKTEPDIRAWVRVDDDGARAAANRAPDGTLAGVTFAVKDIIDVAGLPTECGSPLRRGRIAGADAWLVERLSALWQRESLFDEQGLLRVRGVIAEV
ncbi:amidase family protein [Streptomyces sp. NPDC007901]|uniref:amidase family protein n=1 Tax=Streptomyces sp. NPDC007901 TaxID=3364785 RepID=UPI0036E2B3C1